MRALLVVVALFLSGSVSAQTNNCGGVGQTACNVAVTSGGGGAVTQGTSPWVTSTPDVRALDQTINSATPSAAYTVPVNGQGEVGFSISGLTASTATLTPECTNNIGAASPVWAGCMAISGSALNATITADGAYRIESGGRTGVRLRVTTTGTGAIIISSTAAATSSLTTMAQSLPAGTNVIGTVTVGAPYHLVSSTLTTPTGVTYTAATSANPLAICANASVTICAPLTITISGTQTNSGYVTRLVLQKSTTGATAASFRLNIFETAPTMTAIYDATAYTIPAADVLSKAWLGGWSCSTANANLETFECFPDAPAGYNAFNTANGTIYGIVAVTSAYVRATGETFNIVADISATVP